MKEYIEREAALSVLQQPSDKVRKMMAIPAADVVKVRSGVWTEKIVDDWTTQVNPFMRRRFYCSACGDWNTHGASKYCPNCGARMDGGADDE